MKFIPKLVLVIVLTALMAGPIAADTTGEPNLSATVSENRFAPGDATDMVVTIVNRGRTHRSDDSSIADTVTVARGVSIEIDEGDAPIDVKTAERSVGSIHGGELNQVPFHIIVPDDAEPGKYDIDVDMEYEYVERIDQRNNVSDRYYHESESVTRSVTILIEERPRFEIEAVETDAFIGGTGTVTATVTNVGSATAADATFTLNSDSQVVTFDGSETATTFIDRWEPGETRKLEFETEIDGDADRRSHPLVGSVSYTDEDGQEAQTRSITAGLTPQSGEPFSVASVESDLRIGDTGALTVAVTNVAGEPVKEAVLTLSSENEMLNFGTGSSTTSVYVEEWDANETRPFTIDVDIDEDADTRSYPLTGSVEYERGGERRTQSRAFRFGVTPSNEQTFAVEEVDGDLRVGDSGTVRAEIVNTGDETARNVVATLGSDSESITVLEPSFAVGTLKSGERARVEFDVDVSDSARSGPRQFTLDPEYRTASGARRTTDQLDVLSTVDDRRDVFRIDAVRSTHEVGASGELVLAVTNIRNETLRDISAKLFVESPISVTDDEAFIENLEPNETREIRFAIGVGENAMNKTYPVEVDFRYEDADGDDRITDTHMVPVRVTMNDDDSLLRPFVIGTITMFLLTIGGYLYWRP